MKKLITLAIAICIFFIGCSPDGTVGVIGDTDSPTPIYSGDGENHIKKPVRLIMVDGDIYYDTGKVSDITPRCGTLDGKLTKTVNEFEIPRDNNECNFDADNEYFGYQSATSITKEVPINGEWVIFKMLPKLIDSEYKYCFYMKGRMPNAQKDTELIVRTNDYDLTFLDVTKSVFSSNSNDRIDAVVEWLYNEDNWGITLSAVNITPTSARLFCEQFGGNPKGDLQTGSWFVIEKNVDGNWNEVPYINPNENYAWTSEAWIIPKNERLAWDTNWEYLYGELSPGHYRIGKKVNDMISPGDFNTKIYYSEFNIE